MTNKWRDGYAPTRHKVQVVHDEAMMITPQRADVVSNSVGFQLHKGLTRFPMELNNVHMPMLDKYDYLE